MAQRRDSVKDPDDPWSVALSGDLPPPPLARLLTLALDNLSRQLQDRIKAAGFTDQRMAHNAVFAHLPPEGITLADLARRAGMSKQAMSELVVDLEGKGYLTRRSDDQDGRVKIIELSERGWAAVRTALRAFEEMEQDLERTLGTEELRNFRRALEFLAS